MIRKILLSIACLFLLASSKAQVCTPDASLMSTGLAPSALPHAKVNVQYEQTITVRLFKDTTAKIGSATIPVQVDSMLLINILGAPAGFTYQCLAPNCRFLPLTNTCVKISGTPTKVDSFPLAIVVRTYGKSGSFSLPPQTDTVRQFSIVVDQTGSVSDIQNKIHVFPQPANQTVQFVGIPLDAKIEVSNLQGKKLKLDPVRQGKALILQVEKLPAGMYLLHYGNHSIKFVKE